MDGQDYPPTMPWYEIAGTLLYYVLYYATLPVVYILLLLFYVLRFLLSPFIHAAQVIVHVSLIPYNIAAKFEAGLPSQFLFIADPDRLSGTSSAAPSSLVLS